jgi:hypothetical protein
MNQTYLIGNKDEVTENDEVILYFNSEDFICKINIGYFRFLALNRMFPFCHKNILLQCFFKYSLDLHIKMAKGEFNPNYDEVTLNMIKEFHKLDMSTRRLYYTN